MTQRHRRAVIARWHLNSYRRLFRKGQVKAAMRMLRHYQRSYCTLLETPYE